MPFCDDAGDDYKTMKINDLLSEAKSKEKLETGNETPGPLI
jgi:hypothetical protein